MVELQSRSDWKTVCNVLNSIYSLVDGLDKSVTPKTDLSIVTAESNALLTSIERFSITRIGRTNIKREVLAIVGTLEAVENQVKTEGKSVKHYEKEFSATKTRIEDLITSVLSKVDNTVFESEMREEVIETAQTFSNLSDAMREVVNQLSQKGEVNTEGKSVNRDIVHIANIVENNAKDETRMNATLKNSFIPGDPENFTIVKGPIITNTAMNETKLKESHISYEIVYFPGVKYTFQRHETVPRMYILRDQILVAIKLDASKQRFQLKLNKNPPKKMNDQKRFAELREEIIHSLNSKLHTNLVDVLEQKSEGSYIVSSRFPGVRFLWLVRSSVYTKIGPFSPGSQVGMPF